MNGEKDIKKIEDKQKVEPIKYQPFQQQAPMQFPPMWTEVNYNGIRIGSSYEDVGVLMSWLKYLIDLEKQRRPGYLG